MRLHCCALEVAHLAQVSRPLNEVCSSLTPRGSTMPVRNFPHKSSQLLQDDPRAASTLGAAVIRLFLTCAPGSSAGTVLQDTTFQPAAAAAAALLLISTSAEIWPFPPWPLQNLQP
jgi:hypothetical protein